MSIKARLLDGKAMLQSPLSRDGYRPHLSGHETFPLRYGWLKKALDAVAEAEASGSDHSVFVDDAAIARFGVGKNMVASMRHWAVAAGMIDESGIAPTRLGSRVFRDSGFDPYMENPATAWLVHWQICTNPRKTTWFWAFNHYSATIFEREMLIKGIAKLAKDCNWRRTSAATIKNDVACFLRTYVSPLPSGKASQEGALESPLAELGLIRPVGRRDGFRFVFGHKPSLGLGIFCYAVTKFWLSRNASAARTLSFSALAHEPGSPGRVFLLNEDDLAARLSDIEDVSNSLYRWSETAGLKQLIRKRDLQEEDASRFIEVDYERRRTKVTSR